MVGIELSGVKDGIVEIAGEGREGGRSGGVLSCRGVMVMMIPNKKGL